MNFSFPPGTDVPTLRKKPGENKSGAFM